MPSVFRIVDTDGASGRDQTSTKYFPDGVSGFWGSGLVAKTVDGAIDYYQGFIDAGIDYFVFQSLDIFDRETLELVKQEVEPVLQQRNGAR